MDTTENTEGTEEDEGDPLPEEGMVWLRYQRLFVDTNRLASAAAQ